MASSTTADDVRRSIDTDLDTDTIQAFIGDAEDEIATYNDPSDFKDDGEYDRLVRYYAALLIEERANQGGEAEAIRQGSRRVDLTTSNDSNGTGWLRNRVRANDPSGELLDGRKSSRHFSFSDSPGAYGTQEGDYGYTGDGS